MFHHSRTMGFDTQFCAAFWAEGAPTYTQPPLAFVVVACPGEGRGGGGQTISPCLRSSGPRNFVKFRHTYTFLQEGHLEVFAAILLTGSIFDRRKFVARNSGAKPQKYAEMGREVSLSVTLLGRRVFVERCSSGFGA